MGNNPLNSLKRQMEQPVQTVSQPSYVEQQEKIDDAVAKRGEEVNVPEGFKMDEVGDAVANGQENTETTQPKPSVPTPVVQSMALSQDELDEITGRDILNMVPLVAKEYSMPKFLDFKPRDKSKAFRLVNFKSHGGMLYDKSCAFGFRNAKKEDIEGELSSEVLVDNKDGSIRYFDTILMIIDKRKLTSKYAENFQRSVGMVQKANQSARQVGSSEFASSVKNYVPQGDEHINRGDASKVQFYIPSASELNK